MNRYSLKMAGLAAIMLTLCTAGFAQLVPTPGEVPDDTAHRPERSSQEIIIKHKTDKDVKVTIEIKNGEVFVNGKPASEYQDDNLAITKRSIRTLKNGTIYMDGGDMAMGSPFRKKGGWNMDGYSTSGNRAFLGVTSIRTDSGPAGAKVGEVSPGSGADKAGVKEGDLITKVDEMVIDGPEDLVGAIRKYKPEDKVTITFKRDGKEQKVTATLGKGKSASTYRIDGSDGQDFNFDFKDLVPPNGFNYGDNFNRNPTKLGIHAQDMEDGKGVKVLEVDEESAAGKAGIKEGDIITRFDGTDVNSATALAIAARGSRAKTSVHVVVLRAGKVLDLEVKTPRKLKTADL